MSGAVMDDLLARILVIREHGDVAPDFVIDRGVRVRGLRQVLSRLTFRVPERELGGRRGLREPEHLRQYFFKFCIVYI